ncbi:hypothetical protein LMG31506_04935 [Cupriavidus yeoncheonensis]|uniref:Wadjet protein JetD C-terminal domain-containing protein n=1 Tax=Cupriavidus yeoncheonensis TaxID=1462994 RepID=A0A916IX33_9BURK|nr:hypothetical protein [Cupriavidus yeoncheonensis]CAG2153880.1 hypothetical protein LMG31506_04935 [Cupriavidus yeoncheonensis]
MDWQEDGLKIAALRLLLTGQIARTKSNGDFVNQLDDVGILCTTPRRDVLAIVPDRLPDLERFLTVRWPEYRDVAAKIQSRGLPIETRTLRSLRRDHLEAPADFPQLNRKTWAAWAGAHSKAREVSRPDTGIITTDDTVRARVNVGLRLRTATGEELDLHAYQQSLTETPFPDRGLSESWVFAGTPPRLLLTVENIGAFVDIKKPDDCFLVHSPGWNLPNVRRLRARLPPSTRWRHFGDLDPNGLKIGLLLTSATDAGDDAKVWIPNAAVSLLQSHSLPLERTWNIEGVPDSLRNHPAAAWLIGRGRWLEQEPAVLLPEFTQELNSL